MSLYNKVNQFIGYHEYCPARMVGNYQQVLITFYKNQLIEGDDFYYHLLQSIQEHPRVWKNAVISIFKTKNNIEITVVSRSL